MSTEITPERIRVAVSLGGLTRRSGGFFNSVRYSSKALLNHRVDVAIYAPTQPDVTDDLKAWSPLKVNSISSFGPSNFGYAPALAKTYEKQDPHLIHQHGLWMHQAVVNTRWQKRADRPLVVSPRGHLDHWALARHYYRKKTALLLYQGSNIRNASCLHALNSSESESIRRAGYIGPIALIPNGTFLPDRSDKFEQENASSESGKKRLVFIGRLAAQKGVHLLVEAFSRLPKDIRSDWELLVAGWGATEYLDELYRIIRKNRSESFVKIVGEMYGEEKDLFLRSSDAFILPSFSEGMPMAVLEAMAYGLPCFVTPECNLDEAADADAVIMMDPVSIDNIVAALTKGLDDEVRLESIGANGRVLVAERYTWSKIAEKQKHLYEWLLGVGNQPTFVSVL